MSPTSYTIVGSQTYVRRSTKNLGVFRIVGLTITPSRQLVVRASASQLVDLGFIPQGKSYQKTLKNGIHNFPARCSAHRG